MGRQVVKATILIAVLAGATSAYADREHRESHGRGGRDRTVFSTPEFDPAAAGVIATILVGGGLLVARRRKR